MPISGKKNHSFFDKGERVKPRAWLTCYFFNL